MDNPVITVFKSLYDQRPFYTHPSTIFASIKTGHKQVDLINQIRTTSDKEEKDTLKRQLPVICFAGKFRERKISALVNYSRLVILDFDNVNTKVKKAALSTLPFVYAIFVSPSGNGVKALVHVSSDNHLGHFKALAAELDGIDKSGKDLSRACFISYDPELYLNDKADVYTKIIEEAFSDQQKLDKLKLWLSNKGEQFVTGNRNNFLAKLAGACNRFGLAKEFVESAFERDYVAGSDFSIREAKSVVNSMYNNYPELHSTASFNEPLSEDRTKEILSGELKTSDVIYLKDVAEDLIKDYTDGTPGGTTTYFPSIDPIYRPLPGDLNVLSGIGGFGKTAFKLQSDLVVSVKESRKHAYFGPENFPPLFWYREIVRSYVGKPLEKEAKDRMTLPEYKRGMDFVMEYFSYVYPKNMPTPEYLMERFAEVIIKDGVKSITVDPWNQLLHIMSKRDDIYLGEVLSKFERFAQEHQVYLTIICHPNRTSKDDKGNYLCPDVFDLNGGPVWNARATNICFYHRPFYGVDKTDPAVEFHSKKIKRQMVSGIPGVAMLDYDRSKGRFYDGGYSPLNDIIP